jgi:tocopherol cyclase
MASFIYTTLHPEMYHGMRAQPPFFEGWYFKLVNPDESVRYAIIPGIFLGENGHAFIQVLDGVTGETAYHTFPISKFQASDRLFDIRIGASSFNSERIILDIAQGPLAIKGEIRFAGINPWPVTWSSPGIMGWYAWMPKMECYHGVVSLDHILEGSLEIDGEVHDFTSGHGYIEKDWGQAFPEAWVWFQSNHFELPGTCITASVATIPWMGSAFRGFIIGLWHEKQLYRFTTYTGAKISSLAISDEAVDWKIQNRAYRLEMRAERAGGGLLLGPTRLEMGKRVVETLNATVSVRLVSRNGDEIFLGTGRNAGLEVFKAKNLISD